MNLVGFWEAKELHSGLDSLIQLGVGINLALAFFDGVRQFLFSYTVSPLWAFVAKELQPYLKTFPSEYYENLFRIYGYEYPPKDKRPQWRPAFFGHITNNVIYARLAPDLLPELKKTASKMDRKTKLHSWLTHDIGHPKLREHLASIVTLLKLSKTKEDFFEMVDKIHPQFDKNYEFDFTEGN